jgi:hypothetical protein
MNQLHLTLPHFYTILIIMVLIRGHRTLSWVALLSLIVTMTHDGRHYIWLCLYHGLESSEIINVINDWWGHKFVWVPLGFTIHSCDLVIWKVTCGLPSQPRRIAP